MVERPTKDDEEEEEEEQFSRCIRSFIGVRPSMAAFFKKEEKRMKTNLILFLVIHANVHKLP